MSNWISTIVQGTKPEDEDSFTSEGEAVCVGLGHRHTGPRWLQPILCLSAFQWHARKISSQPQTDTNEVQYLMGNVASVAASDGRILTCDSGLSLVNRARSVLPVFSGILQ
uniref:Late endosomal/lysosomal adaptor and MAPK and MTOR activator 5 n=1 Tax=Mesocestoides corti TaxID=53468 RepID=A0A5K3G2V4_MESCO